MKTRVISGLVGLVILLAVLTLFYTNYFNIIVLAVYCIALWEIHNAFKDGNSYAITAILAFDGVFCFLLPKVANPIFVIALSMFAFAFVSVTGFKKIDFKAVSANAMFGLYVLTGFYSVAYTKSLLSQDKFGYDALFLFVLCCAIAWGSDVFAYFSGYLFGKHKLAPILSPKKTIEGLIGGLIGSAVLSVSFLKAYCVLKPSLEHTSMVYSVELKKIIAVGIIAIVFGAVSVIGDLFASAVKRQVGIKDYGNIMPGHGGIMDRFDSVLILMPFICSIAVYISLIGGIFNV